MQTILVVGAGKTSVFLIDYLLTHAQRSGWKVIVADSSMEAIQDKINGHPLAEPTVLDITDDTERAALVAKSDIAVSLLPPALHILLAVIWSMPGSRPISHINIRPACFAWASSSFISGET